MPIHTRAVMRFLWGFVAGFSIVLTACAGPERAGGNSGHAKPTSTVTVNGEVALHSLMSLSDTHLQNVANTFSILVTMDAVQSAQWEQVRGPLMDVARVNVPAQYWFALPDGSYWTLEYGRADANLVDRAYFSRVMEGETVLGDLVVSRATDRSTAIVAVPVYGEDDAIVGVLGASVYLDRLSEQINEEMNLAPNHIFYSLDETPIVGLHKDPETIFVHPLEKNDPQLERAIREILSREQGVVSYRFRSESRTIHYERSPVTGWWYGFGKVGE